MVELDGRVGIELIELLELSELRAFMVELDERMGIELIDVSSKFRRLPSELSDMTLSNRPLP
jgi:hypothetical protein